MTVDPIHGQPDAGRGENGFVGELEAWSEGLRRGQVFQTQRSRLKDAPRFEGPVELGGRCTAAFVEKVVDAPTRTAYKLAAWVRQGAEQDASVEAFGPEGDVQALERAASVAFSLAMEVPAPATALKRRAMREWVRMPGPVGVELNLSNPMRNVLNKEKRPLEEDLGNGTKDIIRSASGARGVRLARPGVPKLRELCEQPREIHGAILDGIARGPRPRSADVGLRSVC